MNNTKMFIVTFLATLLVISSVPLSLYLINQPSEQLIPDGSLNKFTSYQQLKTFLQETSSSTNSYWMSPNVRGGTILEDTFAL